MEFLGPYGTEFLPREWNSLARSERMLRAPGWGKGFGRGVCCFRVDVWVGIVARDEEGWIAGYFFCVYFSMFAV